MQNVIRINFQTRTKIVDQPMNAIELEAVNNRLDKVYEILHSLDREIDQDSVRKFESEAMQLIEVLNKDDELKAVLTNQAG